MRLLPSPVWPPTEPPGDGSLGHAALLPAEPVAAGAFGTWSVTYTAGPCGIDDGGALRLAFHQTSDAGGPQLDDPAAPNYCSVAWSTPDPCRLVARYDRALGVRPWKRTLALRVHDQAIRPGDTVTVTLGDRSGGHVVRDQPRSNRPTAYALQLATRLRSQLTRPPVR